MKLTATCRDLKNAVTGFSKIVPSKTTLPILSGIKFKVNGSVTANVTDLDATARYTFNNASADKDGEFVIPLTAVKELLGKGGSEDTIEFETLPEHRIGITNRIGSQTVSQTVAGFDPADWPENNVAVNTKPAAGFLESYRKAVPFASTDSTRYTLNSVHIDVAGKGDTPVTLVATDGRRLGCWNSKAFDIKLPTIIPTTKFLNWTGLNEPEEIGIATEKEKDKKKVTERVTHFGLKSGQWQYVTKTVDGTFPNWRQVLPPVDGKNRIVLTDEDIAMLKKVLPNMAARGKHAPVIVLSPGENGSVVVKENRPPEETSTRLELSGGSRFEGKSRVAVSAMYFCDALAAGFKTFVFEDELSPLRSDDNAGGIHVLMPMRVDVADSAPARPVEETAVTPKEESNPIKHEETTIATQEAPYKPEKGRKMKKHETSLEQLQVALETAKDKFMEARQALCAVADLLKVAVKEDKQRRSEVDDVRKTLGKLQALKV